MLLAPPCTTLQSLAVAVQLVKMVLFAQLAAAVGGGEGSSALREILPLLSLTVVYWIYVRVFVPLTTFFDVFSEVSGTSFVCCGTAPQGHCLPEGRHELGPCPAVMFGVLLLALRTQPSPKHQQQTTDSQTLGSLPSTLRSSSLLQLVTSACDVATFVCGIFIALSPPTNASGM